MRSLRALTWLLVLLVLVPAGALAWLGFRSAEAWDAAAEAGIRRDLDDAAVVAERLTLEVLVEADRRLEVHLREFANRVRSHAPRAGLREALHGLQGSTLCLTGEGVLATPVFTTLHGVRLRGADGTQLYPALYDPEESPGETDVSLALLAHLRHESERLQFGDEDADGAVAVWQDARARMPNDRLRATCDVEAALVRLRAGGERGLAQRLVEEVESVWSPDFLWEVGRPAVRLWLAASQSAWNEHAERFFAAVIDGRVDTVPLTEAERKWIRTLARIAWDSGSRSGRVDGTQSLFHDLEGWSPPNFVREVEVAAGARLECWIGGASFSAHVRDRVRDLGDWGPIDVMVQSGTEAQVEAPHHGGVEIGRSFLVEGPNGLAGLVTLVHREAPGLLEQRRTRRIATVAGVASLLALMIVGLLLVSRAVRRERAARRLRDEFIANVSHELRTPLTSVCLHAEMLADEDPEPERRRNLARVVRAEGTRLAALVDDLLDFSALERGVRRLEPEPVDVVRALREAAAPYATLGEREGVAVEVEAPPGELLALADPGALGRILANLLANGWRHGRPSRSGGPGRIRVLAYDGSAPAIEVRDDGPGIAAADREAVFERFRRGRGTERVEGTGIGLSLSRDLARAMGGDLDVVDDADETVFRLTLAGVPETTP